MVNERYLNSKNSITDLRFFFKLSSTQEKNVKAISELFEWLNEYSTILPCEFIDVVDITNTELLMYENKRNSDTLIETEIKLRKTQEKNHKLKNENISIRKELEETEKKQNETSKIEPTQLVMDPIEVEQDKKKRKITIKIILN